MRGLGICGGAAAGGVLLGVPRRADGEETEPPPPPVKTNIDEFMAVPRGPHAIPGPYPGKVVQAVNPACLMETGIDAEVVRKMVLAGIVGLTGGGLDDAFRALVKTDDVVGIKVNPVGPPLISVHLEVVDAIIGWLTTCGLPRDQIVIWDRFDKMLTDAGFTAERFPGVRLAGLQVIAEEEGETWRDEAGNHLSQDRFDREAYYWAEGVVGQAVAGYENDDEYLNQHVFAGEHSYFGKLVSQELTKIINVASFKNTGNGVSMATKNLGYGAICNTGRLHAPLFFRVCTEVLAAPVIRDKLVLNILDGIRGQYDGGPMMNEQFVYDHHSLYFATDPFALDMVGHKAIVAKRKQENVTVNEHPRYSQYLHDAQALGLGVVDDDHLQLLVVKG